jgi:hypothetical protein
MSEFNLISYKIYKNLTNVFEKGVVSLTLSILINVSNTMEMVHLKNTNATIIQSRKRNWHNDEQSQQIIATV